jgi:glutathione S-transferase
MGRQGRTNRLQYRTGYIRMQLVAKCNRLEEGAGLASPPAAQGDFMSLTLHFHPLASFCWKALIALYENDTPFTPNSVDLGNPAERAALKKLWPIGKFPVLRDDARNEIVPESSVIIEYLDRHYPGPTRFIPDDPALALQTRLRDRFYDLYVHLPLQKIMDDRLRPATNKDPHGVEVARAQLRTSYGMIEQQMAAGSWAMGDRFGLADCAALPPLFYGNMAEPFGGANKNVTAYFERLKARPSVARVMREAEPYFSMVPK